VRHRGESGKVSHGGVSERPKEHASKACEVKASVGSNPTATANVIVPYLLDCVPVAAGSAALGP
jgi:hypothetical protein